MLRLLRLFGLLAPFAVALRLIVVPEIERATGQTIAPELNIWESVLSAMAGAGIACLLASLWIGLRLGRLSRAADRIAGGDYEARLRLPSTGLARRLAVAFNALAETLSEKHSAATTDRLTGVANRSALLPALFNEVERVNRYDRPLSVAFIDIDHFKEVNDTYGHEAGDAVLRRVAQILRDNIRRSDIVARYGGEEFMLLLTETPVEEASRLAEKLRMLVMREQIEIPGGEKISVTISIGIAGGRGEAVRFDTIMRDADAAMYSAKSLGRNQTYVFAEPDDFARVRRTTVSAEGRATAVEIGRAAAAAAEVLLRSVAEPLPEYGGKPSDLVARLSVDLARQLDLPEAEVDRIRAASQLLDIGKLAIPSEILEKPAALTGSEWARVTQHPRLGQLIVEQASSLREAVPIILHHHERYSGHGYPHGLRGNDIPLGARILAVADAYAAMVGERPYKDRKSHEAALEELRRHAGTQFDPEIVGLFCSIFESGVPESAGPPEPPTSLRVLPDERSRPPDAAAG